ncbi:MAG: hypothetical protein PHN66_03565 [Candidatus Shapirobacteria bacterium]|nr:hypothetical protein [Candidatus Shapirobacteria bacterium]
MKKIQFEVEKILDLIYNKTFTSNDIAMLFIYLRCENKADAVIKELGHFIAHSDGRNQGDGHDLIKEYILNVIEVSKKTGTIYGNKVIFHKKTIIDNLVTLLERSINNFDKIRFIQNEELIIKYLFEKLDGININFKTKDTNNIKVNFCYLKNNIDKMLFCFNIILNSGAIQIGPMATWCNTLID